MNKLGKYLIILGVILTDISLSLFTFNNLEDYHASKNSFEVLEMIDDNKNEEIVTNVSNLTKQEENVINVRGNDYIGIIEIPALNLELPIMSEFTYDKLKIAPCRYFGSIQTNDLVICGHSYLAHFGNLYRLQPKDIIIINDFHKQYIYEVEAIEILEATDINNMLDSQFDLTLYTCTKDSLRRVTIRANLKE